MSIDSAIAKRVNDALTARNKIIETLMGKLDQAARTIEKLEAKVKHLEAVVYACPHCLDEYYGRTDSDRRAEWEGDLDTWGDE